MTTCTKMQALSSFRCLTAIKLILAVKLHIIMYAPALKAVTLTCCNMHHDGERPALTPRSARARTKTRSHWPTFCPAPLLCSRMQPLLLKRISKRLSCGCLTFHLLTPAAPYDG